MIYIILFLSLLFIGAALILTEKNAPYLLSGYNMMSKEEQAEFDLENYIAYFKKFHWFLGTSFAGIGLALTYFVGGNAGGIFMGIYPIIAYIYFVWQTRNHGGRTFQKLNKVGIGVLIFTLIFVVGLFFLGFKNAPLIIQNDQIQFKGSYGETLHKDDITNIELVEQIPRITMKTNGFALGHINKGYFKIKGGETVKLLLNSDKKPYIKITKKDGKQIFFSSKDQSNQELFETIKNL